MAIAIVGLWAWTRRIVVVFVSHCVLATAFLPWKNLHRGSISFLYGAPNTESEEPTVHAFFRKYNDAVEEQIVGLTRDTSIMNIHDNRGSLLQDVAHVNFDQLLQELDDEHVHHRSYNPFPIDMVGNAGGFCVVELPAKEMALQNEMWDHIEHMFSTTGDSAEALEQLSRHQTLKSTDPVSSGYDYLHFPPIDETENTLWYRAISKDCFESIAAGFQLNCKIATAFCTAILQESCTDPKAAKLFVSNFVGAPSYPGTFQRVAQYRQMNDTGDNLRPHCDWTLATLVPVSRVPGLQVLGLNQRTWITLEALYPNSVVVMAGKWLDILTNGKCPPAIHRVNVESHSPRYSAPFFLRASPQAAQTVDSIHVCQDMDMKEASQSLANELLDKCISQTI